jgi:hypothetical protein
MFVLLTSTGWCICCLDTMRASCVIQLSSVLQLSWVISSCFHSATRGLHSCTIAVASRWGVGSFMGNWKWHLKFPSITSYEWMVLLHAVKVQHGILCFTSLLREAVLQIFIAFETPSTSARVEPAYLASNGEHVTTRPQYKVFLCLYK